ncbi:hypothetical protein G9A89_019738 [Geosiphon pyriformis]|nr:hypothetical protein G9A89_019738 [Geosiphon pyriformis]
MAESFSAFLAEFNLDFEENTPLRYDHSLRLALEYIQFVEIHPHNPMRLTGTRDMLDIACRSALKLGKIKLAIECVEKMETSEPGHLSLKGMIYTRSGRYSDAIQSYIKYLSIRKHDYNVWKQMSEAFLACSLNIRKDPIDTKDEFSLDLMPLENTLPSQLAFLCLICSYKLLCTSTWSTHIEFVQARFLQEKTKLILLKERFEKAGVKADYVMVWLKSREAMDQGKIIESGSTNFSWNMINWIVARSKEVEASIQTESNEEMSVRKL